MTKTLIASLGSLAICAGLLWLLAGTDASHDRQPRRNETAETAAQTEQSEVRLFCAASNQAVMEEIRRDYEQLTGNSVVIQYGPSQTLLSQIEVTAIGDLYLPADDKFLKIASSKGLIDEEFPIATMRCGVAVPLGNPKRIAKLSDLFASDLRLVQANPEAAAVAKLTKQVTSQLGLWDQLDRSTDAYRSTVTEVANDVLVGAADAGIVYDAVLHPYPKLEFVEIPELESAVSNVSLGVISSSRQASLAIHFARFATARDQGLLQYHQHGFKTIDGDAWSDRPELTVYAGSMLRPAIEQTIIDFEEREGVRVNRVYNGCGILVSQMKSGQHPDAYFACDLEFMSQVKDLFPKSVKVSQNQLAILVPKGNPRKIRTLQDLTGEGLKIGIGHEKQCAMGWITQRTLEASGLKSQIMRNVTVQTPTGDMLVNQLRTGSLDAAVAYRSNATGALEHVEAFAIDGIELATATQPWAVAKDSKYPQLANRLFAKICSAKSQAAFITEGFGWQLGDNP